MNRTLRRVVRPCLWSVLVGVILLTACGSGDGSEAGTLESKTFWLGSTVDAVHGTWMSSSDEDAVIQTAARYTFRPDGSGSVSVSGMGEERTDPISSYEVAKGEGFYVIRMQFESGRTGWLLFKPKGSDTAVFAIPDQTSGVQWPAGADRETIRSTPGWGAATFTTHTRK